MSLVQDALLLIGHGSQRYADAGRWLHEHGAALRDAGHFSQVAVGLMRGTPTIGEAMRQLTAPVIRVLPFFIEDGYFTRVAIPAALASVQHNATHLYCRPVGVHPGLAAVINGAIERLCPIPRTWSVVLVGHGSTRAPGQNRALQTHLATLTGKRQFAHVRMGFLEEPPFVADVLSATRSCKTAVVGVFAGDGAHVRDDLPAVIEAESTQREEKRAPIILIDSVCADPMMQSIIRDQSATGCWLQPNPQSLDGGAAQRPAPMTK
jgi:sirohydrochlorin cobaltochelatase